jgi:hypothetical protein
MPARHPRQPPKHPRRRRRRRTPCGALVRAAVGLVAGAILGVAVAVPVSYVFQPGVVRALWTLREYCWMVVESAPRALEDGRRDWLGCARRVKRAALAGAAGGAALGWGLAVRRPVRRWRRPSW